MKDSIVIKSLRVEARVGVPDNERAQPQNLEIDLRLEGDFRGVDDEIERTTDYAAVCALVREKCRLVEFRLIETLAEILAGEILGGFPRVTAVEVAVRKFILPGTQYVGVSLRRER
jgi:dihydroneopterin aldolase